MDFIAQIVSLIIIGIGVLLLIMLLLNSIPYLVFLVLALLGGSLVFYGYKKGYHEDI